MEISGNTVLITGGGSGIGFAMAKKFLELGNTVIIIGRNTEKLKEASVKLGNLDYIQCDITKGKDIKDLVKTVKKRFPEVNLLINNAGLAHTYYLTEPKVDAHRRAKEEMDTNYLSIVRLCEAFLPVFRERANAAIINISSITAFAPARPLPTYGVSKAALHAYTKVLRLSVQPLGIKVFEVMPPLVNTEFSKEVGGSKGMDPEAVAQRLIDGLLGDEHEIHVGQTADFYKIYLSSPHKAMALMNSDS
tara:strand:+ start:47054 stop:47797 length:744 start_codon:yes stop_codon:yes gene_type:complete